MSLFLLDFYLFPTMLQVTERSFVLIQTKEVSMRPEDVSRVFQNSAEGLVELITKGLFTEMLFFNNLVTVNDHSIITQVRFDN